MKIFVLVNSPLQCAVCSNPNLADHPVVHKLESLEDIVHAPGVGVDIEGLHVVVEPGGLKERGQGGVRGHVAGMDGGDGRGEKEGRENANMHKNRPLLHHSTETSSSPAKLAGGKG